jgi:Baseplate J-like protein
MPAPPPSFFASLTSGAFTTLASTRAAIASYYTAAKGLITVWVPGAFGQQILEATGQAVFGVQQQNAAAIRAFASLETAVDPGDVDLYNPQNQLLPWSPGALSNLGLNTYNTLRNGPTLATGSFTFANTGSGAVTRIFGPPGVNGNAGLTFTYTGGSPPTPPPTYVNAPDPSIYTNPDGTVTVLAGQTITIPIVCQIVGAAGSAPSATVTLTSSLTGVSGTNASAILGQDVEPAPTYRARCQLAPSRLSIAGPNAAYAYFANTTLSGTPLLNADGNQVGINRTQIIAGEGVVNIYFAALGGGTATLAEDILAANNNIQLQAFACPQCITFGPGAGPTPPPGGVAATDVTIPVAGSFLLQTGPGVSVPAAQAAIVAALTTNPLTDYSNIPIGGYNQDASGNGLLYTAQLYQTAVNAYPGLFGGAISTPSGSSTALAFGHDAILTCIASDFSITLVSAA